LIGLGVTVFSSSRSAHAPTGDTCDRPRARHSPDSITSAFDSTTILPVPTTCHTPSVGFIEGERSAFVIGTGGLCASIPMPNSAWIDSRAEGTPAASANPMLSLSDCFGALTHFTLVMPFRFLSSRSLHGLRRDRFYSSNGKHPRPSLLRMKLRELRPEEENL